MYDVGTLVLPGDVRIPLPEDHQPPSGTTCSIAVRPEKIWMSDFDASMIRVPGTVTSTVYHGATTQYLIEIASGVTITVLEQNIPRMRHEDRWDDGDRVELGWSPEHVVVLAD